MNPIRVTAGHFGLTCAAISILVVVVAVAPARAQSPGAVGGAAVQGHVRDSSGRVLVNASVSLHIPGAGGMLDVMSLGVPTQIIHTDGEGAYRFTTLQEGDYVLKATMPGYFVGIVGPVNIGVKEDKTIDVVLKPLKAAEAHNSAASESAKLSGAAAAPEFFDEPQFTVAGVTQATNSGGHGSDAVLRTTEALAKATVSLSKESNAPTPPASESSLRDAVARNPQDPALHHQLGEVEEKVGNPLQAVREYQGAAELDPSEPNLFDWGAELLTHRALEPATEVFANGNRRFPKSVRMLVALGVVWYARGSYEQAEQFLVSASDLAPGDPTPYLFLGRMLSVEATPSERSVERLARFAQMQPDNALANYYYAVSLWKESEESARVESLLLKAVHLDPKLGAAYLRLGIFYSQRADFALAVWAYQKAIEASPEEAGSKSDDTLDEMLAESHYRLAQTYLRVGDKAKAQEQLQLHDEFTKKIKDDTDRERREIQQFVIPLRNDSSTSQ